MSTSTPKYCSQCAAPLRANAAFCTACGAGVPIGTTQPQPATTRTYFAASRQPRTTPTAGEQTGFNWGAVLCPGLWHWVHNMRFAAIVIALFVFCGQVVAFTRPDILHYVTAATGIGSALYMVLPLLSYEWDRSASMIFVTQVLALLECYLLIAVVSLPFGKRANEWALRCGGFADTGDFQQAHVRWNRRGWMLLVLLVSAFAISNIIRYAARSHGY